MENTELVDNCDTELDSLLSSSRGRLGPLLDSDVVEGRAASGCDRLEPRDEREEDTVPRDTGRRALPFPTSGDEERLWRRDSEGGVCYPPTPTPPTTSKEKKINHHQKKSDAKREKKEKLMMLLLCVRACVPWREGWRWGGMAERARGTQWV